MENWNTRQEALSSSASARAQGTSMNSITHSANRFVNNVIMKITIRVEQFIEDNYSTGREKIVLLLAMIDDPEPLLILGKILKIKT